MKKTNLLYHGHRFPRSIISLAVHWYFRFQLGLRDIEELLFERGVIVSHESIRQWTDKFGDGFAHHVKAARRQPGGSWISMSYSSRCVANLSAVARRRPAWR